MTDVQITGVVEIPVPVTSEYVALNNTESLHVRRFGDPSGEPVLMIHGAIEDGRIFYPRGRGLAPYLAHQGFDVFVPDLRGHGRSRPPIGPDSQYGQTEMIVEEIPVLLAAMEARKGMRPIHVIAHSWGGVIVSSSLARFPEQLAGIASLTYFGAKRRVRVHNLHRFLKIDVIWGVLGNWLTRSYGYLPGRRWRIGSDNETTAYHRQTLAWIRSDPWVDPVDGFDYREAASGIRFPRGWFMTGAGDRCLGHPDDVYAFMAEHGDQPFRFTVLSREQGNLHDYGHVDILTHPDAELDHFDAVVAWLKGQASDSDQE